jgi:hypothetical protein
MSKNVNIMNIIQNKLLNLQKIFKVIKQNDVAGKKTVTLINTLNK